METSRFAFAHRLATERAALEHLTQVQADEVPLTEDVLRRLRESGL